MTSPDEEAVDYDDLINIVETAHGVRLSPAQIDELNARLDDEKKFFPPMTFKEALAAAIDGGDDLINVRNHALAVAAELGES